MTSGLAKNHKHASLEPVSSKSTEALDNFAARVQVPNNHILTQNLYYNHYYQNPKYPIIRYMDPQGLQPGCMLQGEAAFLCSRWQLLEAHARKL